MKPCTFPGCTAKHKARGYCASHLARWYRYGDPNPRTHTKPACSFPGCDLDNYAHGLCNGHRQQQHKGQPLRPLRTRTTKTDPCACGQPHYAKGLCKPCYRRYTYVTKERKPRAAKPTKPTPAKPKTEAPVSTLPEGWFTRTKQTKPKPKRELGSLNPDQIVLRDNTPDEIAGALVCLARWDALDLADMLGLTERTAA